MLVWAVASQKGGVGKTTTVASLAGWLQRQGLRVLVVDTDPHASLTAYFGYSDEELERSLYDLYKKRELKEQDVRDAVTSTRFDNLDLIASTMALATVDRQLSGRAGVGRILSRILACVENDYDVAIIDCPPVLGALMVNALAAASLVLVPTQTEFLALKGVEGMVKTFEIMQKALGGKEIRYMIVPTMYDWSIAGSDESLEQLRNLYPEHLWSETVPLDNGFRESSYRHVPLPLMHRKTRGATAYYELMRKAAAIEAEYNADRLPEAFKAMLKSNIEQKNNQRQREELLSDDVNSMLSSEDFA